MRHFFTIFTECISKKVDSPFPATPDNEDKVMDDDWANTPMDSTLSFQAPKNLFATGELPKNANNNPFMYETWNDTNQVTGSNVLH